MQIKGKVEFQKIGPGFWGIVDSEGNQWRPLNLPDKMKQEGIEIELTAEEVLDDFSIFMWGKPVNIISVSK